MEPKFHLVDAAGNPLDERFYHVARKLERHFLKVLPHVGDEAVVCNCVEETALKVHTHEQKRGRVNDLTPFFLRVFSNVVKTLLRGPYYTKYELRLPDDELEERAGSTRNGSADDTERRILLNETLRALSEKKRMMLLLDLLGHSAKDIAKRLETTESNVYTTLHRAREEARKLLRRVA
jgi:RNA polymerase sigma factor (sigma-70 family)